MESGDQNKLDETLDRISNSLMEREKSIIRFSIFRGKRNAAREIKYLIEDYRYDNKDSEAMEKINKFIENFNINLRLVEPLTFNSQFRIVGEFFQFRYFIPLIFLFYVPLIFFPVVFSNDAYVVFLVIYTYLILLPLTVFVPRNLYNLLSNLSVRDLENPSKILIIFWSPVLFIIVFAILIIFSLNAFDGTISLNLLNISLGRIYNNLLIEFPRQISSSFQLTTEVNLIFLFLLISIVIFLGLMLKWYSETLGLLNHQLNENSET